MQPHNPGWLRRSRLSQRRHRRPRRRIGLAALFGTAVHQFVTGLAQALHGTQNLAVAVRFGGVIKQQFGDTFVASVRNRAPGGGPGEQALLDFDALRTRPESSVARNAADIGTGATRRRATHVVLPLVDASGFHAELRGTEGGGVATMATANDDDLKLVIHGLKVLSD